MTVVITDWKTKKESKIENVFCISSVYDEFEKVRITYLNDEDKIEERVIDLQEVKIEQIYADGDE